MNKKILYTGAITGAIAASYLIWKNCENHKNHTKKLKVIDNFDIQRYVGKWYEIARFDFKFEKNMDQTTANYSFNTDNSIKVVNKGFNYIKNEWKESVGKALFSSYESIGKLKVSFFGPFYSAYNIISLDDDYQYALIFGKNTDYIWFLSREKTIPDNILKKYMQLAHNHGYDLSRLVWVNQE